MEVNDQETSEPESSGITGGAEEEDRDSPPWLKALLEEQFLARCEVHPHGNKCNMYCIDCKKGSLCPLCCSAEHENHRTIQIRRPSNRDVIRLEDGIDRFLDISLVQPYYDKDHRKVVHLRKRNYKEIKVITNPCRVCGRYLEDSFHFCSLQCKVDGTAQNSVREPKESPEKRAAAFDTAETSGSTGTSKHLRQKRRKGSPHRAPMR